LKDSLKNAILQKITGLSKEQLFLNTDCILTEQQQELYDSYQTRLDSWEPLEYILEQASFYWLDFFVDNRVLIPRNDTEVMVECVLETLKTHPPTGTFLEKGRRNLIYIDIWTWSGCIPVSILTSPLAPLLTGEGDMCYAVDISKKALEVAWINIQNHELKEKITLLEWNLLEPILPLLGNEGLGVVITANLPYIKQDDFENMDESVYLNEPDLALYWWEETWFELYEKLIGQCQELVKWKNKIVLFIELGFDQKEICENFLKSESLVYQIFQDNGWVERCVRVEM